MPLPTAALRAPLRALADLAFPTVCLGCTTRLNADRLAPPLCPACRRRLPPADALDPRFAKLPAAPPLFVHRAALWTYDEHGTVARLQHRLKYGNRPRLGEALGRWLADVVPGRYDLIVAVPLHRQRRLARGYNQSACLARGLAAALGTPAAPTLLARTRATRSQTKLDRPSRWSNVAGAFALRTPSDLAGRHVLLVDDVLTTGATVAAAARPLVAAGADVSLAVLACTREYV